MRTAILILCLISYTLAHSQFAANDNGFQDSPESYALITVLEEIEDMRQIHFLYEAHLVKDKFVTIRPDPTSPIDRILGSILSEVSLTYRKIDKENYILLEDSESDRELNLNTTVNIEIPLRAYTGTVSDASTGEPLIGVSVVVAGETNYGTITDAQGAFSLEVPDHASKLKLSYIGYETVEVVLGSALHLDIKMAIKASQLDEVIVTAVGIEASKRLLGYSVDNVKAVDIANANETNMLNALSGKTAGVLITSSSGAPGASTNIRIRGNKSISGSNKPLIIVDGIPIDNSSAGNSNAGVDVSNRAIDINPNDIESISILKGPAATALYGIRAANGALIITTKTGEKGRPVISIKTSFGLSTVNKLPARQLIYAQGNYVGGQAAYRGPETGEANSYGPKITDLEYDGDNTYIYDRRGRLVPIGMGNGMAAVVHHPEEDFFDTGVTSDNTVSVSGGSDVIRYYVSGGALLQQGVTPKSNWSRYSFKGNFDINLSKRLTLTTNTNVIKSGGDRKNKGNALSGVTIGLYRTPISFDNGAGLLGHEAADVEGAYIFPDGQQRAYRGSDRYDNPYWSVNRVPFTDDVDRIIQGIGLTVNIAEGLNISYKVGYDHYADNREAAWDIHSGSEINGRVDKRTILSSDFNSDLILTYNKRLNDQFRVEATVGHNFFNSEYHSRTTRGLELTKQGFFSLSNASFIESDESTSKRQLYGVYGDLKLGWNDILYLNFTGRNDWSSTLPEQNNSFFYPTVSAGLEFTELFGLTDGPILSYGKIRASYGQVGNDPGLYLTENYFQQATAGGDGLLPSYTFPAFGINAFERSTVLGNADLKAEKTTTFEIGADLKLFKGRAAIDVTYYKATTNDLIVQSQISATSGFTIAPVNAGEILNEGVEVVLNVNPLKTPNFSWFVDLNFTKSKNIVTDLPEGIDQIELASFSALSSLVVEGEPYGILVGTAYSRNEDGQLIIGANGWPLTAPQQIKVGDPNPDWIGAVRNSLQYKGLMLSGLIDVRQGGDIYNGTKGVLDNLGTGEESGRDREVTGFIYEGVTETGEVNTTPVDFANPANGAAGIKWRRNGFLGLAEDNIEDGSWVRLRELTLSYALPKNLFENNILSDAQIAISGRNLWLHTNYSGVDPETNLRGDTNDTGWDYFNLPNTKSYTFSINLKF
jgi:TonB-linked SusC/RagA family outer membrane protein